MYLRDETFVAHAHEGNVLITSEQTQLTLRGLDLFVSWLDPRRDRFGSEPNRIEFGPTVLDFALVPPPATGARCHRIHPSLVHLSPPLQPVSRHLHPSPAHRHPTGSSAAVRGWCVA